MLVTDHNKITFFSLYFGLEKRTCYVELVHIWQEVRETQSTCKQFRGMLYQREACSGTKRVTHSQSRSRSCLPCRESGKSCTPHVKAAVIQTALSSCLNYATVTSMLGGPEGRKAKSSRDPLFGWKLNHFWTIRKLMLVYKEMKDQSPLEIDLHYFKAYSSLFIFFGGRQGELYFILLSSTVYSGT